MGGRADPAYPAPSLPKLANYRYKVYVYRWTPTEQRPAHNSTSEATAADGTGRPNVTYVAHPVTTIELLCGHLDRDYHRDFLL